MSLLFPAPESLADFVKTVSPCVKTEDIQDLRKYLDVPQLSLMAHSFRGIIALEYAARYPEHAQKLIIIDGVSDIAGAFVHWQHEIEMRYPGEWKTALASDEC